MDEAYEKLGWFYLGRGVDPVSLETGPEPLLYDSRDLLTHAAIVGMTGSGKTGLGIALLEEAAIDGVPALVVDPKGDLSNLLLTFPELRGDDFFPYVRAEDAERKQTTRDALAASEAEKWSRGLAAWGQNVDRIRRLREAAEVILYTPGSELARPVSILASFAPPPRAVLDDRDLFLDRVESAATSILSLAGVDADPLTSREHILLSTLLAAAWRDGRSYDLARLIQEIQSSPIARVGAMELETFYPAKDRFGLALRLNNLLAAPGFESWMRGDPLGLDGLLYGANGKPRLAVLSLAHLSDAERMFFLTLLLNETVAWMRSKPGTSSLRAVLYIDELFGFLPPVANPPSKKPFLTLFKQARAFGLGVVVATQNPVDLDYKALSNIGTWFLGRLQTERDKARVLDGLEGVAAAAGDRFERAEIDRLLSGLRSRVFLMHNVHDERPTLFETRWVMSYLAGPLDREAIRRLAAGGAGGAATADSHRAREGEKETNTSFEGNDERRDAPGVGRVSTRGGAGVSFDNSVEIGEPSPVVSPEIPQVFVVASGGSGVSSYSPALLGFGRVFIEDGKRGVSTILECARLARFDPSGAVDWILAERWAGTEADLEEAPRESPSFAKLPARAQKPASYAKWAKDLGGALARSESLTLFRSAAFDVVSRPGESERDFRVRLAGGARERRDAEVARVRERYASKIATMEDRVRRAKARVATEKQQAEAQTLNTVLSGAASVLGMFTGRRRVTATSLGRVGTAVRSFGRRSKKAGDVDRAEDSLEALQAQKEALDAEVNAALEAAASRVDPLTEEFETVELRPKRSDVEVRRVVLAWLPF